MNQITVDAYFPEKKNVELPPVPFDPHFPFHTSKVTDIPEMLLYL